MSWLDDSEAVYIRRLLRIVMMFLERRKLFHQFDDEIAEWWASEKAKIDKELRDKAN